MTTVWVWVFVLALTPSHPRFNEMVKAGVAPVFTVSDHFKTDKECQAALDDVDAAKGYQEGRVIVMLNRCFEYSYPTRPEVRM